MNRTQYPRDPISSPNVSGWLGCPSSPKRSTHKSLRFHETDHSLLSFGEPGSEGIPTWTKSNILRFWGLEVGGISRKNYHLIISWRTTFGGFSPTPLKNMQPWNWVHLPRFSGWTYPKIFELPPPREFVNKFGISVGCSHVNVRWRNRTL